VSPAPDSYCSEFSSDVASQTTSSAISLTVFSYLYRTYTYLRMQSKGA
jgi:hypothetical protein